MIIIYPDMLQYHPVSQLMALYTGGTGTAQPTKAMYHHRIILVK